MSLPPRSSRPYEMPGKVKAVVIILWIGAALGLVAACMFGVAYNEMPAYAQDGLLLLSVLLLVAGAVLNAVFAMAIRAGKNWARITTIVFCVLAIGFQAINLFSGNVAALVGIALNGIIIGLLTSYDAKEWCTA